MKTFIQTLQEGRDAPLYHGTKPYNLLEIIVHGFNPITTQDSDKIAARTSNSHMWTNGISFSRNLNFAKYYGSGVVIEVDQSQLSKRYRIEPLNYFNRHSSRVQNGSNFASEYNNESEEFVVASKHIPFYPYAKRVYLRSDIIPLIYDIIVQQEGILVPVEESDVLLQIQKSVKVPVIKYKRR